MLRNSSKWQGRGDRPGQAAVEMALLLPALLILVFGIILTGFSAYAFIQVTNAAREGARAGSLYRITQAGSGLDLPSTVRNAVCNSNTTALGYLIPASTPLQCNLPGIFNVATDVAVTLIKPDGSPGDQSNPQPFDQLTVQVTFRYRLPVISGLVPVFPQTIVIVRSVMMEVQ